MKAGSLPYLFNQELRSLVAARCAAFRRQEIADEDELKPAAVAVMLVPADDGSGRAAFILTERPSGMRRHANQFALPGGRCDEGETVVQAALREIEEEIGLRLSEADVLGTLDDFPTRSGYLITPVVVWAPDSATLGSTPRRSPKFTAFRLTASSPGTP